MYGAEGTHAIAVNLHACEVKRACEVKQASARLVLPVDRFIIDPLPSLHPLTSLQFFSFDPSKTATAYLGAELHDDLVSHDLGRSAILDRTGAIHGVGRGQGRSRTPAARALVPVAGDGVGSEQAQQRQQQGEQQGIQSYHHHQQKQQQQERHASGLCLKWSVDASLLVPASLTDDWEREGSGTGSSSGAGGGAGRTAAAVAAMALEEHRALCDYLATHRMVLEAWDGDSQLQVAVGVVGVAVGGW